MPFFHRALYWVARTTSTIPLCPTLLKSSLRVVHLPGLQWLLRSICHLWGCVRHHPWGFVALGCICQFLWTSTLFFVLCCSQIVQQWWFLQCSWCIKISRDFRRCFKKLGSQTLIFSVFIVWEKLWAGESLGLWILSAWGRGDASKLTLHFLPFHCGWPYILWFMECWNLSAGLQSSHKDIFVCGLLSNQCFCGGIRAGTPYFAILLISLPLSMYSCITQPLEQKPTSLTAQGAWGVWSHSLLHSPQLSAFSGLFHSSHTPSITSLY